MPFMKGIAEILKDVNDCDTEQERIELLHSMTSNQTLLWTLEMMFSDGIVWLLPEGAPPYSPLNKSEDAQGMWYSEFRRLYLFYEGGMPELKQKRREELFIATLECLDPDDALMFLAMKDGTQLHENVTRELIQKAFPGLVKIIKQAEPVKEATVTVDEGGPGMGTVTTTPVKKAKKKAKAKKKVAKKKVVKKKTTKKAETDDVETKAA